MLAAYARERTDLTVARFAGDRVGLGLVHEALLAMNDDPDLDLAPERGFGPPPIPSSEAFSVPHIDSLRAFVADEKAPFPSMLPKQILRATAEEQVARVTLAGEAEGPTFNGRCWNPQSFRKERSR